MKLKYVIYESDGIELPIVFSSYLSHGDVSFNHAIKVTSAGYCELDSTGRWKVSGQSVTLQRESRPQDAVILNTQIGCRTNTLACQMDGK